MSEGYSWVRIEGERRGIAHYQRGVVATTLCGLRAGDPWVGEPVQATREVAGERCGECIREKMVTTGELRMVRKTRVVDLLPEAT